MFSFAIDDVVPAADRLPDVPLGERYRAWAAFGGDPATRVVEHRAHPLLAAVSLAFAQHRPLVLSPDAVWLTIAQGVAQHVRLHAEALRGRLVRHAEKRRIEIQTDGVPTDAAGWASAVAAFRAKLATEIGDGRARLFECDFSTSTDVDLLASQIVLLDAYSPYFELWMTAVCGIPRVTLLGTPDDWRRIRERVDVIAELDLEPWCRSLRPIADHFVRAAEGNPDRAFWQRIYNPIDAYGGDLITGWITRLYPYVKHGATTDAPNPMLALPLDEPKQRTSANQRDYSGPGLRSDDVPATLSRTTVHFIDQVRGALGAVDLVAGVAAIAQDPDGALRPIAAWHVEPVEQRMADIVARMVAEHAVTRPDPDPRRRPIEGPADVVELFAHVETATLFVGERAWYLRYEPVCGGNVSVARLPDGRNLVGVTRWRRRETRWTIGRLVEDPERVRIGITPSLELADPPSELPLLAGSLAEILAVALDSGGDIGHLVVGRLSDLG